MQARLVVTADDVAYCPCRTAGIASCTLARGGLVSAGSVLVTGAFAARASQAAEVLGSQDGGVSLGLHFNLTEGCPLTIVGAAPASCTLVDTGTGEFWDKFALRERCDAGLVQGCDVERELRAQIAQFVRLYGALPSHVDGHQHVHLIASVAPIVARVLREVGVRFTRLARQRVTATEHPWVPPSQLAFFEWVYHNSVAVASVFRAEGIRFADAFIGLSSQGDLFTLDRAWEALSQLPPDVGLVEWMVHPGFACVAGHGDAFNAAASRDAERLALHELRERVLQRFRVQSYAQLDRRE